MTVRDSAPPAAPVGRFAPLVPGGAPLRFGSDEAGMWPWSGDFDRIRLHARALSEAEIAAEAARSYAPCDLGDKCLGDWTFDAGTGLFPSAGGAGQALRAVGGVSVVAGTEGNAARLAGGSLEIGPHQSLGYDDELTVSFWARRIPCTSGRCLRGRLFAAPGIAVDDFLDHSEIYVTLSRPGTLASDIDGGLTSSWTHVAVTFAAGAVKIFRNGKLRRLHLPQGLTFPPLVQNTVPLRFGAGQNGQPFPGDLDRIRIYGRALGADEIAAQGRRQYELCTTADKCVGEWGFDDAQGTTVPSAGGAGLAARLVGNAEIVDGPDGKAVRLLGGHVEVAHAPALGLGEAFTYSVWTKRIGKCPPGLGDCGDQRLIDKGSWFLFELHHGGSRIRMDAKAFYNCANTTPDAWSHLAFTFDVRTGLRCYSNGRAGGAFTPGQPDNYCANCNGP